MTEDEDDGRWRRLRGDERWKTVFAIIAIVVAVLIVVSAVL